MKLPDQAPATVRVSKAFAENGPELSVPLSELDSLHPAHRQDVLGLMSKFAMGNHLDPDDLANLFRTEGMTLTFPADNTAEAVTMTTMCGDILLTGTPEDVAALQSD